MADFSLRFPDISDDELMDFVNRQENENTKKKTGHDIDIFRVFLRTVRGIPEDTDIHDIPAEELNGHIASFIVNVRCRDGGEYESGSLRGFFSSIDRHLRHHRNGKTLVESEVFSGARDALKAKQIDLKKQGKGNRPNRADPLSDEDVEEIFRARQLGNHSSQAIINTLWLYNSVCFGMRGGAEHHELRWGDVKLKSNDAGREFLQYNERQMKTRTGRCFCFNFIYIYIFVINDDFSMQ